MATVLLQKEDSNRISVKFSCHPDLVKKIKSIKGRCWRPEDGYWTVPDTIAPVVKDNYL